MKKLGKKQLTLQLLQPLAHIPAELAPWALELKAEGKELVYTVDNANSTMVIKDLQTHQSSLEEIFVSLVSERR